MSPRIGSRLVLPLLASSLLPGCLESHEAPSLQIGTRGADGTFVPLEDGDHLDVTLGSAGVPMVLVSLHTTEVELSNVRYEVTVERGGLVFGASQARPLELEADGDGSVLRDIRTDFLVEICCFLCREVIVRASLRGIRRDPSVYAASASVRVIPTHDGLCPSAWFCCAAIDVCPPPLPPRLCAE